MDCDEPHMISNEKTQPIQWTERPTGALVAVASLWPNEMTIPFVIFYKAPRKGGSIHELNKLWDSHP
jgi:hypothetical protein